MINAVFDGFNLREHCSSIPGNSRYLDRTESSYPYCRVIAGLAFSTSSAQDSYEAMVDS